MKEILCSDGAIAQVDDKFHETLSHFSWRRQAKGAVITTMPLADLVAILAGMQLKDVTDHKNRDKLNNLEENLRPATCKQNAINHSKMPGGTSKYKGVSLDPNTQKWRVGIKSSTGNTINAGHFDSEIEAALHYDFLSRKRQGEFAVLNFLCHNNWSCLLSSFAIALDTPVWEILTSP